MSPRFEVRFRLTYGEYVRGEWLWLFVLGALLIAAAMAIPLTSSRLATLAGRLATAAAIGIVPIVILLGSAVVMRKEYLREGGAVKVVRFFDDRLTLDTDLFHLVIRWDQISAVGVGFGLLQLTCEHRGVYIPTRVLGDERGVEACWTFLRAHVRDTTLPVPPKVSTDAVGIDRDSAVTEPLSVNPPRIDEASAVEVSGNLTPSEVARYRRRFEAPIRYLLAWIAITCGAMLVALFQFPWVQWNGLAWTGIALPFALAGIWWYSERKTAKSVAAEVKHSFIFSESAVAEVKPGFERVLSWSAFSRAFLDQHLAVLQISRGERLIVAKRVCCDETWEALTNAVRRHVAIVREKSP